VMRLLVRRRDVGGRRHRGVSRGASRRARQDAGARM
jgi:hypothetical protein